MLQETCLLVGSTVNAGHQWSCYCQVTSVWTTRCLFIYSAQWQTDWLPFNGNFSRTTLVSQHQKRYTNRDFNKAEDDGVAVASAEPYAIICTSLQTDNYASTSSFNFYKPDAVPDVQPTVSNHWRQIGYTVSKTKIIDFNGQFVFCS